MTSLRGPRTQRVPTNATNVGAPSSDSQSAPSEQVGGKDSTAESHAELDTLEASQHTLDRANPSQRLDTTTDSQTGTQSTASAKTLGNVGAPSKGSQSALPEQVGGKDSTTKSHSKLDVSKATPHALDSPDPHSSRLDSTTNSQKETKSTEPTGTLVNVGPGSSEFPPGPREMVGVENTAAESHSEVDTSKASQPSQPASGPDATTKPQKDLQRIKPTKTLGNVGTPSGDSQPVHPEQVAVENSTAESRSEADTSKALQRALDGPNPQSSTGTDMTTNSQKELHITTGDERTEIDVSTPSLTKNPDLSTNDNMEVAVQDSRLSTPSTYFSTSHRSEDGTVSDSGQFPSHPGQSDHTSEEVMDHNEKSNNPSKPCEDASTSSIKLSQKEEPHDTKGANKQKASGTAQAADGQATTPNVEDDITQQVTNHEGDIRGLKAKILSMETFASQKERGYTEKIEHLEAKITGLEKDQQKQEYKEIESFKTRVSTMEALFFRMEHGVKMEHKKEIERLEGKQEKEIQRLGANLEHLETKFSGMERVANMEHKHEIEYLKGEHEKEILRLEAKVERLQTKISSMEHAEHKQEIERLEEQHKQEIERLEEQHKKEIQRLEAVASMLEKEIGRLQLKVSTEEDAKQPKKRQAQDPPPKSPDEKPIASSQASQTTKHFSTAANRSAQQPGVKTEPLQIPSPSIKTNIPSPLAVVPKADTLSVTDVGNLVKALNAEIGQTVNLLTESLFNLEESPTSDNQYEIDFAEVRNYLGPGLCDKLERKSEIDPLITQLALQMGLVNACSSIVNHSPLHSGSIHQTLYNRTEEKEGQAAADEWKAKAFNYLDLPQCEDANKKYLTEVLLKLTIAAGGTLKSSKSLLSQYNQQVEMIAKSAAKLHKTITEDVRSSELITFIISCDTEFDASQMEDSENKGSTPHGKVICTQEMGLHCRKRVEPQNGPFKDWGVTTKAKVVLASTLD